MKRALISAFTENMQEHLADKKLFQKLADENSNAQILLRVYVKANGLLLEYGGTTDSILFEYWFENCLLKEVAAGSTIILDNATFHKKAVLTSIAASYHCEVLFLPPYSPDLNPIEKKWAWLKRKLREVLHLFDSFDLALRDTFQVD